jgi:hypothetical protein
MRVALSSVRVEEPRHTILDGSRAACSSSYESGSCRTREHSALAQGEHQRRSVTPRRARVSVDRTTGFDNRRHHCKREKPNSAGLLPAKRPPSLRRCSERSIPALALTCLVTESLVALVFSSPWSTSFRPEEPKPPFLLRKRRGPNRDLPKLRVSKEPSRRTRSTVSTQSVLNEA